MTTTPDLGIPELAQAQATPEITHNEALVLLQAALNGVIDKDLSTPPGSPTEGDSYIVGSSGTGAWSGWDDHIAIYWGGAWRFFPGHDDAGTIIAMDGRQEGIRIYVRDEELLYVWAGSPVSWIPLSSAETDVSAIKAKTDILWERDDFTLASTTLDLSPRTGDYGELTFDGNDLATVSGLGVGERMTLVVTDAGVIEYDAAALITPTGDDLVILAGHVVELVGIGTNQVRVVNDLLAWHTEVGTFTPVYDFDTTGDLSATYIAGTFGDYAADDLRVIVNGGLFTSSFTHTTASGHLRVGGMPFGNVSFNPVILSMWRGDEYSVPTDTQWVIGVWRGASRTYFELRALKLNANFEWFTSAHATSGSNKSLQFSGAAELV